jgi:porphobilinogen synthase
MNHHASAPYPAARPRRLRQADWTRRLVRETVLTPSDLIWSMVLHDGPEARVPVPSMPGVERLSVDEAARAAVEARALGIPAIAVFPYIDGALKDAHGSQACNPEGLVCRAVKAMKAAAPEVGIMCDVALDPFTDHGHDGLLEGDRIVNDATVERLVEQSMVQADAGCDILAPSDMMDGRVGAIRAALESSGRHDVMIMAYAAKYASAFYGPYRDAIGSSKALRGDKKTYQMDPANTDEALREVALDLAEGATWYGQAGHALPRHLPQIGGGVRRADLRLPGVGRVRDDPRRRPERLDRRRARHLESLARSSAPAARASSPTSRLRRRGCSGERRSETDPRRTRAVGDAGGRRGRGAPILRGRSRADRGAQARRAGQARRVLVRARRVEGDYPARATGPLPPGVRVRSLRQPARAHGAERLSEQPLRLLFCTYEGGGHVGPMLLVAKAAQDRGHAVTVVSDQCNAPDAAALGLPFQSWRTAPNRADKDPSGDPLRDWEAETPADVINQLCERLLVGPGADYAIDVRAIAAEVRADVIVSQELMFGVMLGAETLGLPFVVLTSGIWCFPTLPGQPPFGAGLPPSDTPEDQFRDEAIAGVSRQLYDFHLADWNAVRAGFGQPPLASLLDQPHRAARILLATSRAFDFAPDPLPEPFRYVGPQVSVPAWSAAWESPWAADDPRPLWSSASARCFRTRDRRSATASPPWRRWTCEPS